MNKLDSFQALARHTRSEAVPEIDVTARVLSRIRQADSRRQTNASWMALSGVSVLAASIVMVLAAQAWSPLLDPLAGLFTPLTMVMP